MADYQLPNVNMPEPIPENQALLIASGDLRLAANQTCWAAQEDMEKRITEAFAKSLTVILSLIFFLT